jgi:arginase
MGPSAIRYAGLAARLAELGYEYVDLGNVETAVPEATETGDEHARFLPQIKETSQRIAQLVWRATRDGFTPVVLGGDHSVALGTLAGMREVHGLGGVIWIDAHGDLNSPETSPSGNVHGMVLAAALGLAGDRFRGEGWGLPALEPGRVALVGVRALDDGERELLRDLDVKVFTMSDLDRLGVERSVREAHLAMELVAESGLASSIDIVEVNPVLDRENETGKLAVELLASALGARIL